MLRAVKRSMPACGKWQTMPKYACGKYQTTPKYPPRGWLGARGVLERILGDGARGLNFLTIVLHGKLTTSSMRVRAENPYEYTTGKPSLPVRCTPPPLNRARHRRPSSRPPPCIQRYRGNFCMFVRACKQFCTQFCVREILCAVWGAPHHMTTPYRAVLLEPLDSNHRTPRLLSPTYV